MIRKLLESQLRDSIYKCQTRTRVDNARYRPPSLRHNSARISARTPRRSRIARPSIARGDFVARLNVSNRCRARRVRARGRMSENERRPRGHGTETTTRSGFIRWRISINERISRNVGTRAAGGARLTGARARKAGRIRARAIPPFAIDTPPVPPPDRVCESFRGISFCREHRTITSNGIKHRALAG